MKIGVLSDIHGNIDALEKVLRDAKEQGVEQLWILGDIVGYYYHPEKVLTLLNHWDYKFISGNHEDMLLKSLVDPTFREKVRNKYGSGIDVAIEKLSPEQINFLTTAPANMSFKASGLKIMLCHGSPWDRDFYIYPDSPNQIFKRCRETQNDLVLIGHSHHPFIHRDEEFHLINSGSVGQSRREGGVANWALLSLDDREYEIRTCRYDVSNLIEECRNRDQDVEYLETILKREIK